jgi:hypothetical protein
MRRLTNPYRQEVSVAPMTLRPQLVDSAHLEHSHLHSSGCVVIVYSTSNGIEAREVVRRVASA